MKIHEESIGHFVNWLQRSKRFSMAGFSDAEWYCILGERQGEKTALGQVLDAKHGERLLDVLQRRAACKSFYFAVPKCLYGLPSFCNHEIDWFLGRKDIRIEAFERDMLTDDLAREAGLFPFVNQLRQMPVVIIGPAPLRGLDFLRPKAFVEIATPNLHMEPDGIENAVSAAKRYGKRAAYLVSAGVSAAVIIDQLHDAIPGSWFIDCGSIWDAFVGIGGQRQWRAELYADQKAWEQWKKKNLHG